MAGRTSDPRAQPSISQAMAPSRAARAVTIATALVCLMVPAGAAAQSVSPSERDALVALHVGRGGRPTDLDVLIQVANETGAKGLPVRPLTDKIREGVSKRAHPRRIEGVVRQMAADLETADRLVREWAPEAHRPARDTSVTLLAEALAGSLTLETERSGLTPDEAREVARQVRTSAQPSAARVDALASAAKGVSFIKDAKLSVAEGTALVAEAARRGFGAYDLLDLGRQIKLRERDYHTGRATLRGLRDAIARGDRPEQLFRDRPSGPLDRPAATRPVAPERPERPTRAEPPQRPERPGRP